VKCATVLIVGDFEALNEAYALDHAFTALAASGLSEPFHVLIAEGFENIPADFIAHHSEGGVQIRNVADVVASLKADYPHLEALPDNPTYRVTLLRHLILERVFDGEPVVSVDVDVVWKTDPYKLFAHWQGGDFALGGSGFLTFVGSRDWFEAYREGLQSALTGGALTADFERPKFGITKVLHDQHLIGHLEAKGMIRNDWARCRRSPEFANLCFMSNPLHPRQAFADPPHRLSYRREGGQDLFNGAPTPFWHMQTSFCLACSYHFILQPLIARQGGRPPYPRPKTGRDNVKAMLCHTLRGLIIEGRIDDERLKGLRGLMFRRGIYKAFFEGKFASVLFTDKYWWQEGVFE
jgi:hypothetical protein